MRERRGAGSAAHRGARRRTANETMEVSRVNFDKELDARGLSCPLPILKTKKALNDLTTGQVLKVVATDPGSIKDMQAFATQTGNPLLSSAEEGKDYIFFLKKK
jgi:tRNA 2-thiouridine synthesizing protein A